MVARKAQKFSWEPYTYLQREFNVPPTAKVSKVHKYKMSLWQHQARMLDDDCITPSRATLESTGYSSV